LKLKFTASNWTPGLDPRGLVPEEKLENGCQGSDGGYGQ
jgi:hypothetical protein